MNLCVSHQNSRVQAKDAVTSSSALFSSFSLAHPHAERPAKMREKKNIHTHNHTCFTSTDGDELAGPLPSWGFVATE